MIIACLPSNTTYDIQCPICGRGFLFLTEPAQTSGIVAQRRSASAALAAQHNQLKARSDRRGRSDRRAGQPDARIDKADRRKPSADRRAKHEGRREGQPESLATDQERRTAAPTFRRGSGAVHPKSIFYLQGWDGDADPKAGVWADGALLQRDGTQC